jgi:hypothetical protein
MLGAFVSIEGVSYSFRRLILDDFEALHKRLRPCAIRASPFCKLPRRCQDSPRHFDHAYNSTPLPATVMFRKGIKLRSDLPGLCLNRVRFAPQSSPRSKAVSRPNAERIPWIRQSLDTQTVPIQHRISQRNPGPCDITIQAPYCRAPKHPQ